MATERLIRVKDVEDAIKRIGKQVKTPEAMRLAALMTLCGVPTAVIRCKECQNFEPTCPGYGYCYHWDHETGMSPNEVEEDDFCSYGERRTDNA